MKPMTAATLAALLALALFGPLLPASEHQHGFADQRSKLVILRHLHLGLQVGRAILHDLRHRAPRQPHGASTE